MNQRILIEPQLTNCIVQLQPDTEALLMSVMVETQMKFTTQQENLILTKTPGGLGSHSPPCTWVLHFYFKTSKQCQYAIIVTFHHNALIIFVTRVTRWLRFIINFPLPHFTIVFSAVEYSCWIPQKDHPAWIGFLEAPPDT